MWHSLPLPGMGERAMGGAEIFLPRNSLGLWTLCEIVESEASSSQDFCIGLRPLPWPLSSQATGVGGAQDQIGS